LAAIAGTLVVVVLAPNLSSGERKSSTGSLVSTRWETPAAEESRRHGASLQELLSGGQRERGDDVPAFDRGIRGEHPPFGILLRSRRSPVDMFVEAGRRGVRVHCKVMIVDGAWISVGSTNFDNRSFRVNDEANLSVLDRDFARQLTTTFEADKARSRRITLEEFAAPPMTRADRRENPESLPLPGLRRRLARRVHFEAGKGGAVIVKRPSAKEQLKDLLYQALETEIGGVQIYTTALQCAVNEDLAREWQQYLEQTRNHVRVMLEIFAKLGMDPEEETPGRVAVRQVGSALVEAMHVMMNAGNPDAAQLVAAECIVLAETKDHLNWELMGEFADKRKGEEASALKQAHAEVEEQEDEHLYHTTGWCRELWIQSLGMPAVLPPPEEEKEVKTAIGAARARQSREELL
jgi:rubrerythrin